MLREIPLEDIQSSASAVVTMQTMDRMYCSDLSRWGSVRTRCSRWRTGEPGNGIANPRAAAERIHAVLLSGGSAFGLNAAAGVMQYLEEHDIGFDTRICKVPLVLASCIYDLGCGRNVRPDAAMGYEACVQAEQNHTLMGNHGVGTGATVGKCCGPSYMMKSGLGIYAVQTGDIQVGAVIAVNALGDVLDEAINIWQACAPGKAGDLPIRAGCSWKNMERQTPCSPSVRQLAGRPIRPLGPS